MCTTHKISRRKNIKKIHIHTFEIYRITNEAGLEEAV